MSHSIKNKNSFNKQNLIITSKYYTLQDNYEYNLNLAYPLDIPSVGRTYLYLQKFHCNTEFITPDDTTMLYVYMRGVNFFNKVISNTDDDVYNLVATVPLQTAQEQFYLGTGVDSEIIQEIYDNQTIANISIIIRNQDGILVKFAEIKPFMQFVIETDYSERVYDGGSLLIEQKYQA